MLFHRIPSEARFGAESASAPKTQPSAFYILSSGLHLWCARGVGEAWSVGEAATNTIDVVTPQSAARDAWSGVWVGAERGECGGRVCVMMRNRGICMKAMS